MGVLEKICFARDCKIEDIVEVVNGDQKREEYHYGKQEV